VQIYTDTHGRSGPKTIPCFAALLVSRMNIIYNVITLLSQQIL